MRIESEKTLDLFRGPKRCEYCKVYVRCEAAHIYGRGAGRVDIPMNLCSLCQLCHRRNHIANSENKFKPTRRTLLRIVAAREQLTPDIITKEVYFIRRLKKDYAIYNPEERTRDLRARRRWFAPNLGTTLLAGPADAGPGSGIGGVETHQDQ